MTWIWFCAFLYIWQISYMYEYQKNYQDLMYFLQKSHLCSWQKLFSKQKKSSLFIFSCPKQKFWIDSTSFRCCYDSKTRLYPVYGPIPCESSSGVGIKQVHSFTEYTYSHSTNNMTYLWFSKWISGQTHKYGVILSSTAEMLAWTTSVTR